MNVYTFFKPAPLACFMTLIKTLIFVVVYTEQNALAAMLWLNKCNVVYRHIQIRLLLRVPITTFQTYQQTNQNIIFKIFSVRSFEQINSQEPCRAVLSISYQFIFLAFFLTSPEV